jgi:hypothetical protein
VLKKNKISSVNNGGLLSTKLIIRGDYKVIEIVLNTINRVYLAKDYECFSRKCTQKLKLPEEFYSILKQSYKTVEIAPDLLEPSKEWFVHYGRFAKDSFNVKYKTIIQISKLTEIYYIQHEFELVNIDDNRMGPVLDGFSGEAYTKAQYSLHEKIADCLTNFGYTELSYAEMNEVVCTLVMPEGRKIFGPQITVETALFRDVFDICTGGY